MNVFLMNSIFLRVITRSLQLVRNSFFVTANGRKQPKMFHTRIGRNSKEKQHDLNSIILIDNTWKINLLEHTNFKKEVKQFGITNRQDMMVNEFIFFCDLLLGSFHTYDTLTIHGNHHHYYHNIPHKIHVYLPKDYENSGLQYPVIYLNDGDNAFWEGGLVNKSLCVSTSFL